VSFKRQGNITTKFHYCYWYKFHNCGLQ